MWCPRLLTLWTIDSSFARRFQFFWVSSPIGLSKPFLYAKFRSSPLDTV